MLNKLQLKWKIFALLLGFCALLLITMWLFQSLAFKDMSMREQQLRDAITLAEQQMDAPHGVPPPPKPGKATNGLLYTTGAMVLVSVVLAFVIARWVSRPIEEISKSAAVLAKGDYSTRFSGTGFREIAELSDTLNTAAVELGRVEGLRRELLANVSIR